jgi:hypothetical protein
VGNDPINFRDPSGMEMNSSFCGAEYGFGECGSNSGFWGGSDFGQRQAKYNREYAGMPPNMVAAFSDYNERLQNTLDAIVARAAMQQYLASERTDLAALERFLDLMSSNPTLVYEGPQIVLGPFVVAEIVGQAEGLNRTKVSIRQCATAVQIIAAKYGKILGPASNWYGGAQVVSNEIAPGTVIISGLDANGKYPNADLYNHAGFFLYEEPGGFAMLEDVKGLIQIDHVNSANSTGGHYSEPSAYFVLVVPVTVGGGMRGGRR